MSRPPRPHGAVTTTGSQRGDPDTLNYLPSEYQDLLDLQRDLAQTELDLSPGEEEGDFLNTLMELSSVVGHILGVYQDRYAGEAFLSTATAQSSLVRHARRLAYVPDAGVSATGAVVLTVKDDLEGTVEAGLALASAPRGTIKAQDFETLADLEVSASINALTPSDAWSAVTVTGGAAPTTFAIEGTGHGLAALDVVALIAGSQWAALTIQSVEEDEDLDRTNVTVFEALDASVTVNADTVIYAAPSLQLRAFGWNADPAAFPPADLKDGGGSPPATTHTVGHWYSAYIASDGAAIDTVDADDIYLDQEVKERLEDTYVIRRAGGAGGAPELSVFQVTQARTASVAFYERSVVTYQTFVVDGTTLTATPAYLDVDTHISGTVTALQVQDVGGVTQTRTSQPFPTLWLAGFKKRLPLCATTPNTAALTSPLNLEGELPLLSPGRLMLLGDQAGDRAELIEVVRAEVVGTNTQVYWQSASDTPLAWTLDDVIVYGNVAEISHGRTVHETLGSSDGVTAFQRFKLKQSPLTHLSDSEGAAPVVEVRVSDVAWTRVTDLWDSGPNDRHYRLEIDETLDATVVFGDGQTGAVPPAGTRNVSAIYRVGVGTDGDMGVGRVTRIKKAHPLLKSAYNFTSVTGGAAPATADEIREQATRYIRTFDRAVSVSDYADLALLYPGVARAAAKWDAEAGGVSLVAATSTGGAPSGDLRGYLDARRDTSVPLTISTASAKSVTLFVEVTSDAAYLTELVKQAVRDALYGEDEAAPGLFTFAGRDLGQAAFLSEVYALIEGVEGVVSAVITAFSLDPDDGVVYDVLQPDQDQWLSMEPNTLTISVEAEEV